MNSFLLWFGGLLVAVMAALFAVPYFVDWNSYRGVFEEEATRVLGRKMRVGGSVNLRLLPVPYVRFEKVRIADDTGALGAPFFGAEAFTLWLSVPPLLKGVIEAKQVELEQPTLNLAVDSSGSGNWRSFRFASGSLPFVPSDVALQSVKISDGRLSLRLGGSAETVALSKIDGDFSADALSGPYRFRGEVDLEGKRHELRFNSGAPEADGGLQFKVVARGLSDHSVFAVDGTARDLSTEANIVGHVTAQIPIGAGRADNVVQAPSISPEQNAEKPSSGADGPQDVPQTVDHVDKWDQHRRGIDVRSKLSVDARGFKLDDIVVSFDGDGPPQLMEGVATGTWQGVQKLGVKLDARWLDLDSITRVDDSVTPLEVVRGMGERVFGLGLREWNAEIKLTVDQANLGREAIGDLVIDVAQSPGEAPVLRQFSGSLPGGARLLTSGRVAGAGQAQFFDGRVTLHGGSLARFVTWASRGRFAPAAVTDRPFSLSGGLNLRQGGFALNNVSAEIAGQAIEGAVVYSSQDVGSVAITLRGDAVDVAPFVPNMFGQIADAPLSIVRGQTFKSEAGAALDQPVARWLAGYKGELRFDVKATRLSDGTTVLHNADFRGIRTPAKLQIQRLAWTTPDGLNVVAEAAVDRMDGTPKGAVKGWITTSGPVASRRLGNAVSSDLPASRLIKRMLTDGGPISVGVSAVINGVPNGVLETKVEGTIGRRQVRAFTRLAGGLDDWEKKGIEASLDMTADNLPDLLRMVGSGEARVGDQGGAVSGAARLAVRASGSNAAAVRLMVDVESAEAGAEFDGRARLLDGGRLGVSGKLRFTSEDGRLPLAVLVPGLKSGVGRFPVSGHLDVESDGDAYTLAPQALRIGTTAVSGSIRLAWGDGNEPDYLQTTGRLDVGWLSVDHLLGLLTDAGGVNAADSRWSDGLLKLDAVDQVRTDIVISADALSIGGERVLTGARTRLKVMPGSFALDEVTGGAAGGKFSGRLALSPKPLGVQATAAGALEGVNVAHLFGTAPSGAPPGATGSADLKFGASATGLSTRSIVAALTGSGTITTHDVVVSGVSANAVHEAASAVLTKGADSAEPTPALLDRELRLALQNSRLQIGTRRIPFAIAEGGVRVEPYDVVGESGVARNVTTVDMLGLKIDSEWRITASKRPAGARDGAGGPGRSSEVRLPAASVIHVGPLSGVGTTAARLDYDALERELTVLRIEGSVERLERLRRDGEESAKKEAVRLKELEAERRRATEASTAGSASGTQPAAKKTKPKPNYQPWTFKPIGD